MALREVLAQLAIEVTGGAQLRAANTQVSQFVAGARTAAAPLDAMRGAMHREGQEADALRQHLHALEIQQRRTAAAGAAGAGGDSVPTSTTPSAPTGPFAGIRAAFAAVQPYYLMLRDLVMGIERAAHEAWAQIHAVIVEGDRIGDSAARLGVTAHAYQEWSYVAEQTGTSIEAVGRAFPALTRTMTAHGSAAGAAFRRLGVDVRDSQGQLRSQEAVFGDVIGALARVRNPTQQAALAQQTLGRAGQQLLPLIRQTPGEVDRLRRRFQELGGGLSDDVVDQADSAQHALTDLDLATRGIRSELVSELVPGLTKVITTLATWIGTITNAWRQSSAGETILMGLRAAWTALRPVLTVLLAPIALLIAGFVGLFLVIEDLVTYAHGGKSVLGRFLEPFMTHVRAVRAEFSAFVDYVRSVAGLLGIDLGTPTGGPPGNAPSPTTPNTAGRAPALPSFAPPAPVVASAVRGARAALTQTVQAPISIVVQGVHDAEAAAQAAGRVFDRRVREFADTLALAPEPA